METIESEKFEKVEKLEGESYIECRFLSCDFSEADFGGPILLEPSNTRLILSIIL